MGGTLLQGVPKLSEGRAPAEREREQNNTQLEERRERVTKTYTQQTVLYSIYVCVWREKSKVVEKEKKRKR